MKSLEGFFDKFRNRVIVEVQNRVYIAEIIKKNVGVDIEIENIGIVSGIVTLKNCNHSLKNEIYIKKEKILKDLNKKIRSTKIADIK
ncbi:MAG TPA: hypothetical protein VJC02_01730 [Candidatus Paceibacterota bacterium]